MRNAVYHGPWLSDAKKHFSKSNCQAYNIGKNYLNGSPIRQEYLETTIKWINDGKVERYMAENQHKPNANELWLYFQAIISWIKVTFPTYRKEMKGIDWGKLYNEYKDDSFDSKKLEKEVSKLMQDDDVTKKSGVYSYVLTGQEKYLSIRAFTDNQKREVYEKQKGKCNNSRCPEKEKEFAITEMEADHVTPWHEGGKLSLKIVNCYAKIVIVENRGSKYFNYLQIPMSNNSFSFVYDDNGWGKSSKLKYQKRRQEFINKLNSPVLLWGVRDEPSSDVVFTDIPYRVYQEPNILYFTGIKQKQVALWLNPFSKGTKEILFVPTKTTKKEFWEGYQLGLLVEENSKYSKEKKDTLLLNSRKEIQQLTGFDNIENYYNLKDILAKEIKTFKLSKIGIFQHRNQQRVKKDFHYYLNLNFTKAIHSIFKWNIFTNISFLDISYHLWKQRLKLDKDDEKHLKKACQIAINAFKIILKECVKNAKNEKEIHAYLEYQMKKHSEYGEAFSTIVANGKNAGILHYIKNDESICSNSLLLLDFGVRYHHVHSDISRTIPVNGKFNPLQRLLYEVVLQTNNYVESKVRAGITLTKLNTLAWDYLEDKLQKTFLDKGGKMDRFYQHAPHGIGHLLGYQVHDGDLFGQYKKRPLEVGEVITNEPGLYGTFSLKIKGKNYKEILGIRIEDDLLITKKGCVNLTQKCPKTVEELEAFLV